jgi:hypothetical protein
VALASETLKDSARVCSSPLGSTAVAQLFLEPRSICAADVFVDAGGGTMSVRTELTFLAVWRWEYGRLDRKQKRTPSALPANGSP